MDQYGQWGIRRMIYLSSILVVLVFTLGFLFNSKVKTNYDVDSMSFYKLSFDYIKQSKDRFYLFCFVVTHILLIVLTAMTVIKNFYKETKTEQVISWKDEKRQKDKKTKTEQVISWKDEKTKTEQVISWKDEKMIRHQRPRQKPSR